PGITALISAPVSSFMFSSFARSDVTSAMLTPSHEPPEEKKIVWSCGDLGGRGADGASGGGAGAGRAADAGAAARRSRVARTTTDLDMDGTSRVIGRFSSASG